MCCWIASDETLALKPPRLEIVSSQRQRGVRESSKMYHNINERFTIASSQYCVWLYVVHWIFVAIYPVRPSIDHHLPAPCIWSSIYLLVYLPAFFSAYIFFRSRPMIRANPLQLPIRGWASFICLAYASLTFQHGRHFQHPASPTRHDFKLDVLTLMSWALSLSGGFSPTWSTYYRW